MSALRTEKVEEHPDPITPEHTEIRFKEMMEEPLRKAAEIGQADIVIGIPFYNEADNIGSVMQTVREGLEEYYPGQKAIIVAVGSPVGNECLKVIRRIRQSEDIKHLAFLLEDEVINGKGWAVCAAMEIARAAGADLAIIEADLISTEINGEVAGLSPEWIHLLLEPIKREKMDLVISCFNRHYFESPISTQLVYPVLAAIYDCPVHDAMGGLWGISHRASHVYLEDLFSRNAIEIGSYGIDVWLATTAAASELKICECHLGVKFPGVSGKNEIKLRHTLETLFGNIVADKIRWTREETAAPITLRHQLPTFGARKAQKPEKIGLNILQLVSRFRRGFNEFHEIYGTVLPYDTYLQLEALANGNKTFGFPSSLWVRIIYHFLLAFAFTKDFAKGDLVNAVVPLFEGRLAGLASETELLRGKLRTLKRGRVDELISIEAANQNEALVEEFILQKQDLLAKWYYNEETLKPPVPRVTYREFIPGVKLVVPTEMNNPEGGPVNANGIYDSLFTQYTSEFEGFVFGSLGVPRNADSAEIVRKIRDFMYKLEKEVDTILLPGDLLTLEGTREVVNTIFEHFSRREVFSITEGMAFKILSENLPSNLITRLGYNSIYYLLREFEANDVLALANWSEEAEYEEGVLDLLYQKLNVNSLNSTNLEPVIVSYDQLPLLVEIRGCGGLCKLAGRIVVTNQRKGTGGQFPKLRYLTSIAKEIIEMERFGEIWRNWAEEKKDLKEKMVNSIKGHWGREPLSAHNIFEDGHQRVLVERMKELADKLIETADGDESKIELANDLKIAANAYNLALTLTDGTFVPCSIWTWSSYSAKGGVGLPTPLSLHVERDWSSHDFLVECYKASGGKEEAIDKKILELMEQGREWEDLAPILLGIAKEADAIIQAELVGPGQPPALELVRYRRNPILKPVKEHTWESKYVLNPGAIKLQGRTYLVYRATGDENVSRLGLAVSNDGYKINERLEKPIFQPKGSLEQRGCEDARLTLIGDRVYMIYTAYDGIVAQIGMASIGVKDFIDYKWSAWRRHGMVFPGVINKDGSLFPEQINGKYAMLHRVDPHIWITFSSHLYCPWTRKEHKILAGSTYGMLWDGKKIGGGAPPIKTKYGWLLITHGVDYQHFYRLGNFLLDLNDPRIVLYRSPNAILEPVEKYEKGKAGKEWVPNVVFTCGAVPVDDEKYVLEAGDEILVYYGAADSAICVAKGKVGDLIPEEYRQEPE